MELRVLKYFLTVAREENITKAAEVLHITQPTLSRQLAELERELGVKLFRRSKYKVILTEEGAVLRRRAQEIIDIEEKAKKEVSHSDGTLAGKIYVANGALNETRDICEVIAEFHKMHPAVTFDVSYGRADYICEKIEEGTVDVGILISPLEKGACEFCSLKRRSKWYAIVKKGSVLSGREAITAKDLSDVPLVMPSRLLERNEFANWFGEYYDSSHVVATFNAPVNGVMMAANGMGVAICVGNSEIVPADVEYIPLDPPVDVRHMLVWKRHQTLSRATKEFIAFIKNAL